MGVSSNILFILAFLRTELAAAFEYRFNFVSQTVGMFLNDVFWIFFWLIFFNRFHTIAGWNVNQVLMLTAISAFGFGLAVTTFGNARRLSTMIEEGRLDYYISMPKNVLLHTIARFRYSGVGDVLFGLFLGALTVPIKYWPLFLFLGLLVGILMTAWAVLINSVSFFVGRFETAARATRDSIMLIGFYPWSVYSGWTKLILLFVIPAGFVGGVPVEIISNFSWTWLGVMVLMVLALTALAIGVFYAGLRRYESGSGMGLRS